LLSYYPVGWNTWLVPRLSSSLIINLAVNEGVREGCPLTPVLFNIYVVKVIIDWLQVIKQNILTNDLILNIILFLDDQVIVENTEDEKQKHYMH
jgi:hypothetical protein